MSEDQDQLIKDAQSGDREAFGEIYRIFLDRIYRFVYFLVREEPLAEDITQNTFLKAWDKIGSFSDKRGTMQAYLYTIARNLVIDNQRKKKAQVLTVEMEETISTSEDLEGKVIEKESQEEIKRSLDALPVDDREIIILKYFEDMDYSEIAKIVKKREGAIRARVFRALKVLREFMEKGSK
jgi:RNA polymerase sigma-70 factor (ECF subfamily)